MPLRGGCVGHRCGRDRHDEGDESVAVFVADYLALIPDAARDKTRAAERLRGAGRLVLAAARLVPWLPTPLIDGFIADYLQQPAPGSPLFSVIYEIAALRPDRLRPYAARIDHPWLREGMLSGAPDTWVTDLVDRWHDEHDPEVLDALARVRTPAAADVLLALRDEVDDRHHWETLIGMAGRLPDGHERSSAAPAFLGFVVKRERTMHVMGGAFPGDVPICPICDAPAERVLTLDAGSLPFRLHQNPSFFWYTCDCDALDFTTVQIRPEGLRVFFTPQGRPSPGGKLVPGGERGLLIEPHPNQTGVSLDAFSGSGRHQVGGPPRWIQPDSHPRCPGCSRPMTFVASVDSGLTPFGPLGFEGTLYGFWCDGCAISDTRPNNIDESEPPRPTSTGNHR
ncbi:MAG: hypothetical protein WBF75_21360 [Pseudonocardiaceae bacterium]